MELFSSYFAVKVFLLVFIIATISAYDLEGEYTRVREENDILSTNLPDEVLPPKSTVSVGLPLGPIVEFSNSIYPNDSSTSSPNTPDFTLAVNIETIRWTEVDFTISLNNLTKVSTALPLEIACSSNDSGEWENFFNEEIQLTNVKQVYTLHKLLESVNYQCTFDVSGQTDVQIFKTLDAPVITYKFNQSDVLFDIHLENFFNDTRMNISCVSNETNVWTQSYSKILKIKSINQKHIATNLSGCTYYQCNFDIMGSNSNSNKDGVSFQTPDTPVTIINVTLNNILKNEVHGSIYLKTEFCKNNSRMIINCTSFDRHQWVIRPPSQTVLMNNSEHTWSLTNLSEFTNYTCDFIIDEGYSVTSISFRTLDGGPSEVQNLTVSDVTSRSFNVTWEEPSKIPAVIFNGYSIVIERDSVASSNHFVTKCSDEPDSYYSSSTENSFFHYTEALPDYNYIVTVYASTNASSGENSSVAATTIASESEPPQNLTKKISQIDFTRNIELNLDIEWEMPCNTHGPVDHFVIELTGTYQNNTPNVCTFNQSIISNITRYNCSVPNLMASSHYKLVIYAASDELALNGLNRTLSFSTSDNYPSAPEISEQEISAYNFSVKWEEPSNNPGNITRYLLTFSDLGSLWQINDYCEEYYNITASTNRTISPSEPKFVTLRTVPSTNYSVQLRAETSRGQGNFTEIILTSNSSEPHIGDISTNITFDSTSEKYKASCFISFTKSCLNGLFKSYEVCFKGTRKDYPEHSQCHTKKEEDDRLFEVFLRPEHTYDVNVTVANSDLNFRKSVPSFTSPAGIPKFNASVIAQIEPMVSGSTAIITLKEEYFDSSPGNVRFYAIIVSNQNTTGGESHQRSNTSDWPEALAEADVYYQATDDWWEPFSSSKVSEFKLGEGQGRNALLEPGRTYYVYIRMLNSNFYRNTFPITITTDPIVRLGLILGLTFGLAFAAALGFLGFVLWRKRLITYYRESALSEYESSMYKRGNEILIKVVNKEKSNSETEIDKENFVKYVNYLEQNPVALDQEWEKLKITSAEIYSDLESNFALLPENKRKNRYTNILPFDESRVKLKIDEDDDICSDYINASYIKGSSCKTEYIATQGPLPHTVRDFWKMVFQENANIIIMVAQFTENRKEKCYKYFPNNHESMLFGDDIEVRCVTELHFQIYCIRTLQVRRKNKQLTVTHMQYLEWPDFGVPEETESLLLFCHQLRERWDKEGGVAVVHCSAGVGRTGTIIATDILLAAKNAGKKLDVFNTVLELRKQRKCMVQTKRQYMYIYELIKSDLEHPMSKEEEEDSVHLYENIALANETKNGLIESVL